VAQDCTGVDIWVELSLLTQALDNFMQIEVEALGCKKKKLLNRLFSQAPLDSFISFCLKMMES